jgi:hypothetical protein
LKSQFNGCTDKRANLIIWIGKSKKERLTISTVHEGPFQEYISVTGAVIPKKTIYLDAAEGGQIEKIYVEAGSYVNQGQDILNMSNTDMLLEIMTREAEFFQLNNDLRNAQLILKQNELALRAQLLELDYKTKLLRQKLAALTIKAPVSGHLTALNAEIGESKKQGGGLAKSTFWMDSRSVFRWMNITLPESISDRPVNLHMITIAIILKNWSCSKTVGSMNLIYSPQTRGIRREENKQPLRSLRLERSRRLI